MIFDLRLSCLGATNKMIQISELTLSFSVALTSSFLKQKEPNLWLNCRALHWSKQHMSRQTHRTIARKESFSNMLPTPMMATLQNLLFTFVTLETKESIFTTRTWQQLVLLWACCRLSWTPVFKPDVKMEGTRNEMQLCSFSLTLAVTTDPTAGTRLCTASRRISICVWIENKKNMHLRKRSRWCPKVQEYFGLHDLNVSLNHQQRWKWKCDHGDRERQHVVKGNRRHLCSVPPGTKVLLEAHTFPSGVFVLCRNPARLEQM